MKGGPSVEVLLDLAFDKDAKIAKQAAGGIKNAGLSMKLIQVGLKKNSMQVIQ